MGASAAAGAWRGGLGSVRTLDPPCSLPDANSSPRGSSRANQMATFSAAPVIIDGKGHLLGRLASIVAKQLLNGQKVVVVRCELINASGSFFRNKVSFSNLYTPLHPDSRAPGSGARPRASDDVGGSRRRPTRARGRARQHGHDGSRYGRPTRCAIQDGMLGCGTHALRVSAWTRGARSGSCGRGRATRGADDPARLGVGMRRPSARTAPRSSGTGRTRRTRVGSRLRRTSRFRP